MKYNIRISLDGIPAGDIATVKAAIKTAIDHMETAKSITKGNMDISLYTEPTDKESITWDVKGL